VLGACRPDGELRLDDGAALCELLESPQGLALPIAITSSGPTWKDKTER